MKNFHHVNIYTSILSIITIVILISFKEIAEPKLKKLCSFSVPIDLIVVIFSILACWLTSLDQKFNIKIVGSVPSG